MKKGIRRVITLALAMLMLLSLGTTALAANGSYSTDAISPLAYGDYTVTVSDPDGLVPGNLNLGTTKYNWMQPTTITLPITDEVSWECKSGNQSIQGTVNTNRKTITFSIPMYNTNNWTITAVKSDYPPSTPNNEKMVVWVDTMTFTPGSNRGSSDHANYSKKIASVTLGGKAVQNSDSGSTNGQPRTGDSLYSFFGGDKNGTRKLEITPQEGYYVNKMVIVCYWQNGQHQDPYYACNVWQQNGQFTQSFDNVSSGGSVSVDLKQDYFTRHYADGWGYYILVEVLPIPTPLYVEYSYGNIDFLGDRPTDSPFNSPSTWTTADSRNVYGTGLLYQGNSVLTANTQFAYQYPDSDSTQVNNWKHYANTVTSAALNEATNAGYYFAGWSAEYLLDYNVQQPGTNGNNYNLNLSNHYANGNFAQSEQVALSTNVRLTAQWKPVTLNVKKTVMGLPTDYKESQTYTFEVQKQGSNGTWEKFKDVTLTVNGNGSVTSESLKDVIILPGTYQLVETAPEPIEIGTTQYNSTFTSNPITITATDILAGTVAFTLEGTNTYTDKPLTTEVNVTKIITGNMGDVNKSFTISVTFDQEIGADNAYTLSADKKIATFTLGNNGSVTIKDVPIGAKIKNISESNAEGYQALINEEEVSVFLNSNQVEVGEDGLSFTIENKKEVIIDTGIFLDSLPYVLILAVVAVGAVVFLRKRRARDED